MMVFFLAAAVFVLGMAARAANARSLDWLSSLLWRLCAVPATGVAILVAVGPGGGLVAWLRVAGVVVQWDLGFELFAAAVAVIGVSLIFLPAVVVGFPARSGLVILNAVWPGLVLATDLSFLGPVRSGLVWCGDWLVQSGLPGPDWTGWAAGVVLFAGPLLGPRVGRPRSGQSSPDQTSPDWTGLWTAKIAGPDGLLPGSSIECGSVTEDLDGVTTWIVHLDGSHALQATTSATTQGIEVALGLPIDSVQISAVRDKNAANRITVTVDQGRHLEAEAVSWPGPVLQADGSIPIGVDKRGKTISIAAWNKTGVEHGAISGTTGTGKNGSSLAVISPTVLANKDVLIWVDGGRGSSSGPMHDLATITACQPKEWDAAIDLAHALAMAREQKWGREKRSSINLSDSKEPMITLMIDEVTSVSAHISSERVEKISEYLRIGRKVGCRLIQSGQSMKSDHIIGGTAARMNLYGNGFIIAHPAAGSSTARMAVDGVEIDGISDAMASVQRMYGSIEDKDSVAGFAVICRRGSLLASPGRIFNVETKLINILEQRISEGWKPLQFADDDLLIAESSGLKLFENDFIEPIDDTKALIAESPAMKPRYWIENQLKEKGPCKPSVLLEQAEEYGIKISRATLYRHGQALIKENRVFEEAGVWSVPK